MSRKKTIAHDRAADHLLSNKKKDKKKKRKKNKKKKWKKEKGENLRGRVG